VGKSSLRDDGKIARRASGKIIPAGQLEKYGQISTD